MIANPYTHALKVAPIYCLYLEDNGNRKWFRSSYLPGDGIECESELLACEVKCSLFLTSVLGSSFSRYGWVRRLRFERNGKCSIAKSGPHHAVYDFSRAEFKKHQAAKIQTPGARMFMFPQSYLSKLLPLLALLTIALSYDPFVLPPPPPNSIT